MSDDTEWSDKQLIGYAIEQAAQTQADWASGQITSSTLSNLVFHEAELAWLETGLLPSPKHSTTTQAEIDTICKAIVARTAAVLVLNGWTPPGGNVVIKPSVPPSAASLPGTGECIALFRHAVEDDLASVSMPQHTAVNLLAEIDQLRERASASSSPETGDLT